MTVLNNNGYFAAANSRGGFVSFFKDIFRNGKLDYLYIIKGGSGTGKSRLMREIAHAAECVGEEVEYFYCSSDPRSLDGIILKGRGVGVIDGTAPHSEEPNLPGCADEIINLGEFWDSNLLRKNKAIISELTETKRKLYQNAYSYLAAAGQANEVANLLTIPALKKEKLDSWAKRTVQRFGESKNPCEEIRLTSAISYMGECDTGEFYNAADRRFVLCDTAHISPFVFASLRRAFFERGCSVSLSFSALDTGALNGIFVKGERVSFTEFGDTARNAVINTDRFLDKEIYRQNRTKIRFLRKSASAMVESASETMKEIYEVHSKIEKIYASAMDFDAKEKYTKKLIKTVLGK